MDTKRIFDILMATVGLVLLSPVLLLLWILVRSDSKGGVMYRQIRVGKNMEDFHLYKFRTMYVHTEDQNLITVGNHDARITKIGYWLRKYKLDELPQLLNILRGHMSFVGPRPEVRKYVNMYNDEQRKVLSVKPGITDWASLAFFKEGELLESVENPEEYYVQTVIPEKISCNLKYITHHNVAIDLQIIWLTFKKIVVS